MKRLIVPAKARNKLVAYHTDGKMDKIFPILDDIGFDIVHPIEPESNDIFAVKDRWGKRFVLVGNIPTVLLAYGSDRRDRRLGSNSTARKWAPAAATCSVPPPASWRASRRRTSWP